MFTTPALPAVLTVVFVLTGGFGLVRYARLTSRSRPPVDVEPRAVELLHLLMSVAMVAMVWGWSGGPSTGSGIVQIVVFGLVAAGFGVRALVVPDRRLPRIFHAVMAAAMVWMVAATPALMASLAGAPAAAVDGSGMDDMPGMAMAGGAGSGTVMTSTPAWVTVTTACLAVALGAMAVTWLVAAARGVDCSPALGAVARPAPAPEPTVAAPASAPAAVSALVEPSAVTAPPAVTGPPVLDRPRAVACCHLVMSAGMAVALAAML